jgi:hypothetical protein
MGATTTISVFHHDRYRSCVVPAVRRLLRSGELGPWLQAVWDHRQSRYPATVGRPFVYGTHGGEQLELSADLELLDGHARSEWFDFPTARTPEWENLIDLFQHALEGCCLGDFIATDSYAWLQFPYDFGERPQLQGCLWYLGNGSLVWNNCRGGFSEGVCWWLSPAQTAVLARELHRTTLPNRGPDPAQLNADPEGYYELQALHRLARLRDIADRAWELGHGLFCGNDMEHTHRDFVPFVIPYPAYSTENVQLLARAIRDRREFDVLPVLADALQEAGCENEVVLSHCRDVNEHTDACWVADLILANGVT